MLLQVRAWTDAEGPLRECVANREQQAPDDWRTHSTKSMLGGALLGQEKYADAEPPLLAGYEGLQATKATIPAPGMLRLTEALERLVQLYESLEKPEEAARWRSELEATKPQQEPAAN
jgi:hypothetical protein